MENYKPLWVINFKEGKKSPPILPFSSKEQIEALDYLLLINSELKLFTDLSLKHTEKTPEIKQTLAKILQRCNYLERWIGTIKSLFKSL
ncbi:hypothetical protein PHSC3_000183 [Chlamydiales bacterium STE3]|nr:hypothetical protein PHSC3_000183 [Chlamydiales bacterium STE3]